jgi:hypothetical protein
LSNGYLQSDPGGIDQLIDAAGIGHALRCAGAMALALEVEREKYDKESNES